MTWYDGLDCYDSLEDFLEAVQQGKAKRPFRWWGDYYCNVCGEPWDIYGVRLALRGERHADMTKEEAERFKRGEGCPDCKGKPDRSLFEE